MERCTRSLVLKSKAFENEINSLAAVAFSAIKIVCVATSRLIDLVIPVEEPYGEVQQDSELVILGFRPPSCSKESKVRRYESIELALVIEYATPLCQLDSECVVEEVRRYLSSRVLDTGISFL